MAIQNLGPSPANGQFFPAVTAGNLYSGGNQAVVATAFTAGVPTAYTGGLILANPLASGVRLIIQGVSAAFVLAQTNPSAISLGIGYSASALAGTLTAVTSVNGNPGSANTPVGVLYSSASVTLPVAPKIARLIGSVNTGAETTGVNGSPLSLDLQGSIVLPPGGFACILSSAAGTASSFLGSFTWVETVA